MMSFKTINEIFEATPETHFKKDLYSFLAKSSEFVFFEHLNFIQSQKTSGIYALFDNESYVCLYVGQSIDIKRRWYQHISALKKQASSIEKFNEWFKNTGMRTDRIAILVIEEVSNQSNLNEKEFYWFKLLTPMFFGRVPAAATNHWQAEIVFNEEVRKKLSEATKAYHKANPVEAPYGRKNGAVVVKKTCAFCNENFLTVHKKSQFCSYSCGTNNHNSQKHKSKAEIKEEMIKLLKTPITMFELAKKLSVSQPTARKLLKEFDLNNHREAPKQKREGIEKKIKKTEIQDALKEVSSQRELAEKLSISESSTKRLLSFYSLKLDKKE